MNQKHNHHLTWWCTPLITALRRQMQVDLCDLEAKLVYNQDNQGDTVKTLSE